MAEEFRVALVGCGGVARRYRRIYGRLPGVKVVSAIDLNEAEAAQTAAEVGAGRISQNFEDALGREIDVVVLSTPNDMHCEQSVEALRAGKHVLLKKPMARSVEECDQIVLLGHKHCGPQKGRGEAAGAGRPPAAAAGWQSNSTHTAAGLLRLPRGR